VTTLHHADAIAHAIAAAEQPFDALVMVASLTSRRGSALAEAVGSLTNRPPMALITRAGHRGDATRCRGIGIAAYLTLPLSRRDLDDTLRALRGAAATPVQRGQVRALLITRHFLRETRRKLCVVVVGDADDVAATLRGLGHRVTCAAAGAEMAAVEPPDVLVVDVSLAHTTPVDAISDALLLVGGSPAVLALVRDPATPGLGANAQLGLLARQHDTLALQEALRRLRGTHHDNNNVSSTGEGPMIWPAVVRRAEGDERLAHAMIAAFLSHAPAWMVAIERSLHGDGHAHAAMAFTQLQSALCALDLRAAAQLCERLEAVDRGRQYREADALLLELKRQIRQIVGRMRAVADRRRYAGRPQG